GWAHGPVLRDGSRAAVRADRPLDIPRGLGRLGPRVDRGPSVGRGAVGPLRGQPRGDGPRTDGPPTMASLDRPRGPGQHLRRRTFVRPRHPAHRGPGVPVPHDRAGGNPDPRGTIRAALRRHVESYPTEADLRRAPAGPLPI